MTSQGHAEMVRAIAHNLLDAHSRDHVELCALRSENARLRAELAKATAKRTRRSAR